MKKYFKITTAMACVCGAVLFNACEPTPDPNPDPNPDKEGTWVISEVSFDDGSCFSFTYDSNGRVIKWEDIEGGDPDVYTYEYTDTKIAEYEVVGSYRQLFGWFAMNAGLVKTEYDDDGDTDYTFNYNSSRQLVETKLECEDWFANLTWNAGNITQIQSLKYDDTGDYPIQYGVRYGDYNSMNSGCIVPLNRLALIWMIGLYPPLSLGGCFGEVPKQLIIGTNASGSGILRNISYQDFDACGCPRTMVIRVNGENEEIISLQWRQLN